MYRWMDGWMEGRKEESKEGGREGGKEGRVNEWREWMLDLWNGSMFGLRCMDYK